MFSGLVWRGWFVSFGSCNCTVWVTTGIVIRKMISSTSITSTSGVVLIDEIASSSDSSPVPTLIAIAVLLASGGSTRSGAHVSALAEQHRMQVAAKGAHGLHRHLVTPHQPVVAEHGRHRHAESERGHDQRFAHGTGNFVDRRLAGDTDGGQGVIDPPHRAEQTNKGRG